MKDLLSQQRANGNNKKKTATAGPNWKRTQEEQVDEAGQRENDLCSSDNRRKYLEQVTTAALRQQECICVKARET